MTVVFVVVDKKRDGKIRVKADPGEPLATGDDQAKMVA